MIWCTFPRILLGCCLHYSRHQRLQWFHFKEELSKKLEERDRLFQPRITAFPKHRKANGYDAPSFFTFLSVTFFQTYFFKSDRRKVCIKVFVGTPAQDIIDGAKIELGISAAHVHFTDESGDPVIVSSTAPDGSTFILKEGAPETTSSR